ncbi:MAG: hypothetical protein EP343_20180 [Deltaproteobacteria bacterium]|nr:MAG: hypothetical protein EP343_20180 [Deltaproteobacteria bacterium]
MKQWLVFVLFSLVLGSGQAFAVEGSGGGGNALVKPAYSLAQISRCLQSRSFSIKTAHPRRVLLPEVSKILRTLFGQPKNNGERQRIKYLAAAMSAAMYFPLVGRKWSKFRKLSKRPFSLRVFELKKSAGKTQNLRSMGNFGTDSSRRLSFTGIYRFASPTSKNKAQENRLIHRANQFDLNRVGGFQKAFSSPVGPISRCGVYTHIYVNRKLPFNIHLVMTIMHRGYLATIKVLGATFKFFIFRSLTKPEIRQAFKNKAFVKRLKTAFGGEVNLKTQQATAINFLSEYAKRHSGFVMVAKGLVMLNQTGITKKRYMGMSLNAIANNKMLRGYTLSAASETLRSVLTTGKRKGAQ